MARIQDIHREIERGTYPSISSMAEKFGVSTRTIKRDLAMLQDEMHAPLVYDRKRKGFRYANPGWSPPLQRMTEGDLLAFFIAEQALKFTGQAEEASLLRRTLAKMASMFPEELSVNLAVLGENASFENLPNSAYDAELLNQLALASMTQETVRFEYFSPHTGQRTERTADVHLLHNFAGDWYAVCWDQNAQDFRDFHCGRISKLKNTGYSFEKQKGWSRDEYLSKGFYMTRGGRSTTVSILFDSYQAQWIRERGSFHPNERREELPDGSLRLIFSIGQNGLEAVARFCMTYAGNCVAEKPKKLREMIRERSRKAFDAHDTR